MPTPTNPEDHTGGKSGAGLKVIVHGNRTLHRTGILGHERLDDAYVLPGAMAVSAASL